MAATTADNPEYEITNEVRFAVVMYGGVSLAIYINGVAQELLRLVRSTARWQPAGGTAYTLSGAPAAPAPQKLGGTERVYRKLSYLLSDDALLARYRERLRDAAGRGAEAERQAGAELGSLVAEGGRPINTRFVIDILSGTSAGGINGVFLAKALANDQRMDDLKRLWVDEGDIDLLINDKKSYERTGLSRTGQPKSLLNSRRMYYKLLHALHGMDAPRAGAAATPADAKSPFADEIDLFVTATDIEGLTLPLQLADMVVYERRHRSVFHFRYSAKTGDNEFAKIYNPFLAFASRCTSSFPFAFEPMLLSDIDEVLDGHEFADYGRDSRSASDRWKRFFVEHLKSPGKTRRGAADSDAAGFDFANRAYGDGGYLDNKPFSYATSTLARRHSHVPVDRKLIYIEPSPEHPEADPRPASADGGRDRRPDALANVKAALLDLPTYETIREDLQLVLERNRTINRVNRIVSGVEGDITAAKLEPPPLNPGELINFDMVNMAERFGIYFLPYHRLRIASVTDNLASLVADARDFDADSDQFLAVRSVVQAWRERAYVENRPRDDSAAPGDDSSVPRGDSPAPRQKTLNSFLHDFDLAYQLRRLGFLRSKIDQLYRCSREAGRVAVPDDRFSAALREKLEAAGLDLSDAADRRSYQETLSFIKCRLNEFYDRLLTLDAQLRTSAAAAQIMSAGSGEGGAAGAHATGLRHLIGDLGLTAAHLDYVLSGEWEGAGPGVPAVVEADTGGDKVYCGEPSYARQLECVRRARNLLLAENSKVFGLDDLAGKLAAAAAGLAEQLNAVLRPVPPIGQSRKNRVAVILNAGLEVAHGDGGECARQIDTTRLNSSYDEAVRLYLWEFYRDFDFYDLISFPILYNTDVGEADTVEVIRVSPEDAPTLINERDPNVLRRKLAGTSFHHFGAFLDRVWRENDIMWGRLDGAERLLSALLPGEDNRLVREALVREAHTAILDEEMPPASRDELTTLVVRSLQDAKAGASADARAAVGKIVGKLQQSSDFDNRLVAAMRGALSDGELLSYVGSDYEVNRSLDPKMLLRVMSRSTQIIGKVFEQVADQNNLKGSHLRWIARLGQIFWGLVEVAVPNSLLNLLWSHWVKLLYVFWIVVIAGSLLLGSQSSRNFGLAALVVTGVLHAASLVLRDYMRRTRRWWKRAGAAALAVFGLAFLLLAGYGAYELNRRFNPAEQPPPAADSNAAARPCVAAPPRRLCSIVFRAGTRLASVVDGSTAGRLAPARSLVDAVLDDAGHGRVAARIIQHLLAPRAVVLRVVLREGDARRVVMLARLLAVRAIRLHVHHQCHVVSLTSVRTV